jgi:hypothetical protein
MNLLRFRVDFQTCATSLVIGRFFYPKFVNGLKNLETFNHLCLKYFFINSMIEIKIRSFIENVITNVNIHSYNFLGSHNC